MIINPLEAAVAAIEQNSNYITPDMASRLLNVIPKGRDTETPEADLSLESMLKRIGRLVRSLESELTKDGTNATDIKSAVTAAKDLFNLVAKHGHAVAAEKKLDILRRSITEVLSGFSEKDTQKFMKTWKKHLETAQKEAEAEG